MAARATTPEDPEATEPAEEEGGTPAPASAHARWWGLVIISLAQLMVVLDATIVNIALPSAQRELHLSDEDRQWAVTAYTLAFGGLLLLGGRAADLIGRKRAFLTGLAGFALSSALGGAAQSPGMLFTARALQGAFAALLAPSALSLLTTTFTRPRERGRAFGVYGALAGIGTGIGFLLGGVLTQYANWRWCLYVNVPIAAAALTGGALLLRDPVRSRQVRLDVTGALLGCGGVLALVFACSQAQPRGWTSPLVLSLFAACVLLLAAFIWWQTRAPAPLLPLRIVREHNRAGCFLTILLSHLALFGMFLFLTFYLQNILGYSPLQAGLGFLPLTAAIILTATQAAARLLHRLPPRTLIVPGLLLATGGSPF